MKKSNKKWFSLDFDVEKSSPKGKQHKKKQIDQNTLETRKEDGMPIVKRNFNFHNQLKPKVISDLAVHSKKIKEVEFWLQSNVLQRNENHKTAKFLLITGPTGSGKTATVQVLCENMSINLTEWINPVDHDFEVFQGLNQVSRFTEFLTESKWNSLFSQSDKKIILVEEFPNAVMRNPEDFLNVLEECYYKGNYPIVFICTDSFDKGQDLSQTIFPQEIRDNYSISHISFNACASTLMKNALRRAHNLVQQNLDLFKTPSSSTVDAIIATSMGDIRCAINQYYFASLLGTSDLPTVTTHKASKKTNLKRKRNENISSVQLMSRDENLGLFHGLGRVLNPKRIESDNSWKLNCDLDKLIDEFSTQPRMFISFLFENYIKYFGDINDVCKAAEVLSLSQIFLDKWIDKHDTYIYSLWISVFGLMIFNEHKISKWNQIKGPTKIRKRLNNDEKTRDMSVTDLFYYNLITESGKSQFSVT